MHPNGQIPAYEWAFGDVNPPVHAWAAWRVYKIDRRVTGVADRAVPRARLPEAAAELHVVGQPQGRRGQQRLRGRLPGPRQHRRVRPLGPAARRRPPRAVRRHVVDGHVLPEHAGHRAGARARTNPAYEDVATKFFEHFVYIAKAMNELAARASRCGTSRTASTTTSCTCRSDGAPAQGALDGRAHPAVRGGDAGAGDAGPPARLQRGACSGSSTTGRSSAATSTTAIGPGGGVRRLLSIVRRPQLLRGPAPTCSTATSSCRRTASARCRATTATIRTCWRWTAPSTGWTTSRPSRAPGSSAATRTGAGRSGFPSTTCSSSRCRSSTTSTATTSRSSVRPARSRLLNLWEVAAELSRGLTRLFLRGRDGRRPALRSAASASSTDPHWRDLLLFHEYFHGDDGAGIGASHQTGWTGLVAKLIEQSGE